MQKKTATIADDDLRRAEDIARHMIAGRTPTMADKILLYALIFAARHVLRTQATTKRARNDAWYVGNDRAENIAMGKPANAPHIVP